MTRNQKQHLSAIDLEVIRSHRQRSHHILKNDHNRERQGRRRDREIQEGKDRLRDLALALHKNLIPTEGLSRPSKQKNVHQEASCRCCAVSCPVGQTTQAKSSLTKNLRAG